MDVVMVSADEIGWIPERQRSTLQGLEIAGVQVPRSIGHIGRKALCINASHEHVSGQGRREFPAVARQQRAIVGGGAPFEGLGQSFHALGHRRVADTELTQGDVEASEHDINKKLSQFLSLIPAVPQAAKDQSDMQHQQVEPTFERVWNGVAAIENRLADDGDDRVMQALGCKLQL